MVAPQHEDEAGLRFTQSDTGPRSWLPWIAAGAVILLGLALLVLLGGRATAHRGVAASGIAPLDPYAPNFAIDHLKMSEASNFAGGKVTYLDGEIANNGPRTIAGVTAQVVFHNDLNEVAQKETMPLSLIRTREPYVDTEPVSAAPIKPGERRDFRLIFDGVAADWNQQYPEIRLVRISGR